MAENKFAITVTAVDKATKTLNKVNKSVNQLFRPYDNAKKSIKSFSDALGRNDLIKRPLWALDKVGKGVTTFGTAFGMAENSVLGGSARMAQALGMVGGPIGGFLAGTVALVGGATAVSVAMAKNGQDITRTAQSLNISTDALQEYRGAAKQAGLQTETMDSGIQSLGTTLQDALAGRNLQVATLMGQMGLSVRKTKDGAVDTLAAFRDIADVVSHMTDQNQARKLTDMLGISELLPLLRQGSGALDEYIRKSHELGYVQTPQQIAANNKAADSWNQTKTAMDGAGISVGNLIAKYLNLNDVASATTAMVERISSALDHQSKSGFWSKAAEMMPWWMSPKGLFGLLPSGAPAIPTAGRSASGKVTGMAGGSSGSSPLGLRNNNPGNIRAGGGFASYATPGEGLTAIGRNLMAYQDKHGINTIGGIVNRWAPASDGNNVPAYISDVSKQTGFGVDQPLNLHDPKVLAPLISAITRHENGQNPYSPDMIQQAAAAAAGGGGDRPITVIVQNVPHGMTVKPVRGLGQATVGLTMQPGGMS